MDNKQNQYSMQRHVALNEEHTGALLIESSSTSSTALTTWGQAWLKLKKRPLFWSSLFIICVVIFMAIFPYLLTTHDPFYCTLQNSLQPPSKEHWFGFDRQGCDIYSRVIYGARASVTVGLLSAIGVLIIGGTLGATAGYFGGWIDALISRIIDIFFAVPLVLAAIVIMQMFKEYRSIELLSFSLVAFGWASVARITRASALSIRNLEYIKAAKILGLGNGAILFRHVLPNLISTVVVYSTIALGSFIVAEATLSFLGIGLPTDTISWGADIARAQSSLRLNPMVLIIPSCFLAMTVLGFIGLGDVVHDALDPKGKR